MNFAYTKFIKLTLFLFVIFYTFSCSKDADLLSEYVNDEISANIVSVEVRKLALINESIIIDPLENQGSNDVTSASISELTQPSMGTTILNDDNTITYIPDSDSVGTDEFSYTANITNEDGSSSTESGNVTITVREAISEDVAFWQNQFDLAWDNPSTKTNAYGMAKAMDYALSGGNSQEYYYLAWQLDGVIQIWQATGENKYLDDALMIIETCISQATDVRSGQYKGWSVTDLNNNDYSNNGIALYESYLFRYVTSLLRIMHQSPNLRSTGNYQERYDSILSFTKTNIWEKWYTKSNDHKDLYRVNTHMASHWARIGMELYLITGEAVYKEVFDNISFKGLPNYQGASLRGRIYTNPEDQSAYAWSQSWTSSKVQDTSHGADIVSFWTTAYENDMYWTKEDIDALVSTLYNVVWTNDDPLMYTANVDGSGGSNEWDAGFHNFITLGRFDEKLQVRLESYFTTQSVRYKTTEAFGIGALNRKILDDGRPVYPEEY